MEIEIAAMAFTDIFIKRPVLSVVVSLLILLIGLRAAMVLPIRQYPKLSNTVINITTVYPGAAAELIQGFITTPIEQAVASAEGVDYITSSSVQGTSTIQVFIKLNFDPNQALTEVLAKVNSVRYLIPKESNDPVVTKTTGQTTAVMYLGFSSEELSGSAISDYLTRVVQPVLSTVDGVASADILGGQTFAMRLWLDPVKMAGRGVSPNDVQAAIAANNFQAAAGQAKGYFIVSNVTTNTDLRNLDQFKRMIIKSKDGGFVLDPDEAAVLGLDDHALELIEVAQVGIGRHVGDDEVTLGLARGGLEVVGRDRRLDIVRRYAAPGHLDRIEPQPHRECLSAENVRRGHAVDRRQHGLDHARQIIRDRRPRQLLAGEAEIHHGRGLAGGLGHDRVVGFLRDQIFDRIHLGEDLGQRLVRIEIQLDEDLDRAGALHRRRGDVIDAFGGGHRLLDRRRDEALDQIRGRAGIHG